MNKIYRLASATTLLALSVSFFSSSPAPAAPQSVHVVRVSSDEDAIKSQMMALRDAVSSAQAKAVADLWSTDGSYIDQNGQLFAGRAELEKRFEGVFKTSGKVLVDIIPQQVRMIAPTVALASGLVTARGTSAPETRFNMIFVKQAGKWMISGATEVPYSTNRIAHPLSSLEWLVGDWSADKNGASVKMKAEWTTNHNFIHCVYQISKPGEETQVDHQFIGWDPRNEEVCSWSFGPLGGCAYGHWHREEQGWVVEVNGTSADGSKLVSRNIISAIDPNSFHWQSIDRRIGGLALGDTDSLTVQRVSKSASSR